MPLALLGAIDRFLLAVGKARGHHRAAEWALDHAAEQVTGIGERARAEIRETVADHLELGTGWHALADALEDLGYEPERAARIAQMEWAQAIQQSRAEDYVEAQEAGRLSDQATKVWETTSAEPCRICRPLQGQEAFVEDFFDTAVGPLLGPPAHVGCRCRVRQGRR